MRLFYVSQFRPKIKLMQNRFATQNKWASTGFYNKDYAYYKMIELLILTIKLLSAPYCERDKELKEGRTCESLNSIINYLNVLESLSYKMLNKLYC